MAGDQVSFTVRMAISIAKDIRLLSIGNMKAVKELSGGMSPIGFLRNSRMSVVTPSLESTLESSWYDNRIS